MPTPNFQDMMAQSRDRITEMLSARSPLGQVGSAALRAAGSSGRQSFGEIYDTMQQQRLQGEMQLGTMLRQDAQLGMQQESLDFQRQRAESQDFMQMAQALTADSTPGSFQRLMQAADEAQVDFSELPASERGVALANLASEIGIQPRAEFTSVGGALLRLDPEGEAPTVVYRTPSSGSGLPRTTGLPEGYMWGQDAEGNAAAMPIPGLPQESPEVTFVPGMPGHHLSPSGVVEPLPGVAPDVNPVQAVLDSGEINPFTDARWTREDAIALDEGMITHSNNADGTVTLVDQRNGRQVTMPVETRPMPSLGPTSIPGEIDSRAISGLTGQVTEIANWLSDTIAGVTPAPESQAAAQELNTLRGRTFAYLRGTLIPGRENVRTDEVVNRMVVTPSDIRQGPNSALATYTATLNAIQDDIRTMEDMLAAGGMSTSNTTEMRSNLATANRLERDHLAAINALQGGLQQATPQAATSQSTELPVGGEPTSTAADTWEQVRDPPPGIGQGVWQEMSGPERAELVQAWPNMTERERALFQ